MARLFTASVFLVLTASIASAQWYAEVDAIVPRRTLSVTPNVFQRDVVVTPVFDNADPPNLIGTVETVGTETRLSLPDFDVVAGGRVTIGFQGDVFGVEGSYLATDTWSSNSLLFDGTGLLASPFTPVGSLTDPTVDENIFVDILYETEMQSAEINLTSRVLTTPTGESVFIAGFRAITIDELFQYTSDNIAFVNALTVEENNLLVGPQVGIDGWADLPIGSIELSVKGGFAFNDIDAASMFNGSSVDTSREEASLIGEVSIGYVFQPTPHIAIRIGYQLLGITNVGIAATSSPPVGMTASPANNDVLYQMPYAGIVINN